MATPDPRTRASRQAHFAAHVDAAVPDENPPGGRLVEQVLLPPGDVSMDAPIVNALDPVSCPLGPPNDVLLTVSGAGFVPTSQIAFGLDPQGDPQYEPNTVVVDDQTLTIFVSAGLFPSPDAAVPVCVSNFPPVGDVSNTLTFQIGP